MAESFARQYDLATFIGRDVPAALAEMMLGGASAVIRRYCGWHIAPSEEAELVIDGTGSVLLFLPSLFVTEIKSITEEDTELNKDAYHWNQFGILQRVGTLWTCRMRGVTVELEHGYEIVPDDVKLLCLQVAARAIASPAGVKSEQSSGVSVTYAVPGGLAGYEQVVLDPYRITGRA